MRMYDTHDRMLSVH